MPQLRWWPAFLLIAVSSALAQNWEVRQSAPTLVGLTDIDFATADSGWAVGDQGTVIRTTDGGEHWTVLETGIRDRLYAVDFVDSQWGWIMGWPVYELNGIWRTTDGGATWTELAVPPSSGTWMDAHFLSRDVGWIAGAYGRILYTTNGGQSWTTQHSNSRAYLREIDFVSPTHGWAVGEEHNYGSNTMDALLLFTTNGGSTWERRDGPDSSYYSSADFTDSLHGYICGYDFTTTQPYVLSTTDGGGNWLQRDISTHGQRLLSVAFLNENLGMISSGNPPLWRTTDGGANWNGIVLDAGIMGLSTVRVTQPGVLHAVGNEGLVFRSTDGGIAWEPRTGRRDVLRSVHFTDSQTGWIVGTDGGVEPTTAVIMHTTNGGADWGMQLLNPDGGLLRALFFVDAQTGWAAGRRLYHTTNAGTQWLVQDNGDTNNYRGLHFVDAQHGWAVTTSDVGHEWLLSTTNGGALWQRQRMDGYRLRAVAFADSLRGWVCAEDGRIRHSTDGGESWTDQTEPLEASHLYDLCFMDSRHGWAVGGDYQTEHGLILRTTDSGANWSETYVEMPLSAVSFVDTLTGWAVSDWGAAYWTTDGGATWTYEDLEYGGSDIFAIGDEVWVVSWPGIIQHRTGGLGAAPPEPASLVPAELGLTAYPNPFNSEAVLTLELPSPAPVRLELYDITGRRVRTLMDAPLAAGRHEVRLSAAALPSGLYFARLSTASAQRTQKLLLLR